jgi:hypothetical protein
MRKGHAAPTVAAHMHEPPTSATFRRLSLELEPDTEPITGRLQSENGDNWRFTGWLELTRALEQARADVDNERARGGLKIAD